MTPAILFTFDKEKKGFNKNCILDNIQKDSISVEIFQDYLIRNTEKKDNLISGRTNLNNNNNNNNPNANNNYSGYNEYLNPNENTGFIGNAEILEQQRKEMDDVLKKIEIEKKKKMQEEALKKKEVKIKQK